MDIVDNIMDAIDNSHKTVFVVSYAVLQREWTTFTMKLASVYSFRDGREDMNIIILLNDIKMSEFPKLIRRNWEVIHPLRWPNESNTDQSKFITAKKVFWQRLFRRIKRGNSNVLTESVSESTV
ncbi:Toll-like receptor 2 type-2 [Mizuhopecten yessoensis]|uniref:Toll-like receptor 2 type-2 n=1 Tax=Mizuhopecten yessoensis TaxID=6573 RepID=A0A210PVA3_MIZYE|nr:Toll-like receptor 2 type-2 [Mizuhopecten yessoensis]